MLNPPTQKSVKHTLYFKFSCRAHTAKSVGDRTAVGPFVTALKVEDSQSAMSAVGDHGVL